MKLKKIKLRNFFSFGENEVLDLANSSNLVLVKGSLEKEDNSNGAGKSSLFEAVYWCLTGKTVRGVRAAEVVRIGKKEVVVTIEFSHKDHQVEITREWSSNKKAIELSLDGNKETFHDSKQGTQRVFEVLGVSPEILSLVAFYGKKFNTFSSLSPKERAEVIDILAQGQQWEKAREVAYKESKTLEVSYFHTKEQSDKLVEKLSSSEGFLTASKRRLKEEEDINEIEIKEAEEELRKAEEHYESLDKDTAPPLLAHFGQRIEEVKKKKELKKSILETNHKEKTKEIDGKIGEFNKLVREVQDCTIGINLEIQKEQNKAADLRKQKGREDCSKCGQKLPNPPDNEAIEKEAVVFDQREEALKIELKEMQDQRNQIHEELDSLNSKYSELRNELEKAISLSAQIFDDEIAEINKEYLDDKAEAASIESKIEQAKSKVLVAQSQLKEARNKPFMIQLKTSIEHQEKDLDEMQKEKKEVEEKLKTLHQESALSKYWAQGFKDLRFSAFDNTIKVLQELLNAFCMQQGLDFERIEVTSWKENSKGNTTPEINIYVIRNGNKMGLDSLSEGETQRVDLACFFTFSLLIEKSIGFPVHFNVLDEPLSGLDYEGRQKVFDIISELSKEKQIFTIDHDANFQDMFDDVIIVNKKEGVSQLN
jgi:DNA repair exonuclease SbcCD ATPase subunit